MFLGFSYNQHILPENLNLKVGLDYYFNYKLNKNKDLKLKLFDEQLKVSHVISNNEKRDSHIFKLNLGKKFNNFEINSSLGLLRNNKTERLLSLNISYNF